MLHRYWINNLIDDNKERRNLLGLAALSVGSKIADVMPKTSDLVQLFRQTVLQPNFNSVFNNDKFARQTIIRFEDDLLVSNNFYLDIKLPFVFLDRFKAIVEFEFVEKRRQFANNEEQNFPQRYLPLLFMRVFPSTCSLCCSCLCWVHVPQDTVVTQTSEDCFSRSELPGCRRRTATAHSQLSVERVVRLRVRRPHPDL